MITPQVTLINYYKGDLDIQKQKYTHFTNAYVQKTHPEYQTNKEDTI